MYDMTVNMQLVVVFHHSPCCIIIFFFYILSCIECIHVSWCTTVRNNSIIIIIIIIIINLNNITVSCFADTFPGIALAYIFFLIILGL